MDIEYKKFLIEQITQLEKKSISQKDKSINSRPTTTHLMNSFNKIIPKKGLWLEFGVFKGNSINTLSKNNPEVTIYGFDSFQGFPDGSTDQYWTQNFDVQGKLPPVNKNVKLIPGWFNITLPKFLEEHLNEPIAFLHIDCDLYSSTKTVFDLLKDRFQAGTVIIFDEFIHYNGFEDHEIKAWYELVKDNPMLKYEYLDIKSKILPLETYFKVKTTKDYSDFKSYRRKFYQSEVGLQIKSIWSILLL